VTKRLRTQSACSRWRYQSLSIKWLTVHQFDTCRSRTQGYWGLLIVTWRCYNSFCPSHVEYQASSSFSSRIVPRHRGRLSASISPHNIAKCWSILKTLSKQTRQQICSKVGLIVKRPTTPKSCCYTATLRCDVSLLVNSHKLNTCFRQIYSGSFLSGHGVVQRSLLSRFYPAFIAQHS